MQTESKWREARVISDRSRFTDTDSVMVQIFELQDPLHAMAEANLNGAALFDVAGKSKDPERDLSALSAAARAKAIEVMGQLGKLGNETFPARILEYVGLRSKMYSILTVQPDGARKEKRKIKGCWRKAASAGRPSRSCAAARTRSPWRPSRRSRSRPSTTRSTASTLTTRGRWGTGAT